jgi:hypothetical protein
MRIAYEITDTSANRFQFYPFSPEKCRKYVIKNIENCCNKSNADVLYVAKKNGQVVGFKAFKIDKEFSRITGERKGIFVFSGILNSEKRKHIASYFFNFADNLVLKDVDFIIGSPLLHNTPMINFINKQQGFRYILSQYCLTRKI